MKCRICNTEYYNGDMTDPDEPCACGGMTQDSPYNYGGWRYVFYSWRYKTAYLFYKIGDLILPTINTESEGWITQNFK